MHLFVHLWGTWSITNGLPIDQPLIIIVWFLWKSIWSVIANYCLLLPITKTDHLILCSLLFLDTAQAGGSKFLAMLCGTLTLWEWWKVCILQRKNTSGWSTSKCMNTTNLIYLKSKHITEYGYIEAQCRKKHIQSGQTASRATHHSQHSPA